MMEKEKKRVLLKRPRGIREWTQVVFYAIFAAAVILGPIWAVREVREETARILDEMLVQQEAATDRSIRINALTISCFAAIEEGNTDPQLRALLSDCIRAGLEELESAGGSSTLSQRIWLEGLILSHPPTYTPRPLPRVSLR